MAETTGLTRGAWISAYALALIPAIPLLHGSVIAARGFATTRLLALGGAVAALGFLLALLALPENLGGGSGVLLSLANIFRIVAGAFLGISLARYVGSTGVVLLIAAVAVASDLISVFAGPTKALVEKESPVLDLLLLVFPTFGSPFGFGLGVSDFVFLALFAAASRFLRLRYLATLLCVCFATFLALTTGLLLERPLPAIPFVALGFVLVNVDLILASITKRS